jgi:basic membrane protein A
MFRKPRLLLYLLIIFLLFITGCKKKSVNTRIPEQNAMSVALILPGARNDKSWSEAAYDGLMLINSSLQAVIVCSENVAPEDAVEVIDSYAQSGFDLIICHGSEFVESSVTVASRYPLQKFAVTSDYEGNNTNLGGITFRDEEVHYMAGMAAAMESKSGKIGYLGGINFRNLEDSSRFFAMGARSINPSIEVVVSFVGSWSDSDLGVERAGQQLDQGVDVILVNADTAGEKVHSFVGDMGGRTIGFVRDQAYLSPSSVITSIVQDMPVLMLETAYLVQKGQFEGRLYRLGIKENAQRLAPWYEYFTMQNRAIIESVQKKLISGELDLLHLAEKL